MSARTLTMAPKSGVFASTETEFSLSFRKLAMAQASDGLVTSGTARTSFSAIDLSQFQRWLTIATLGLLLVVLLGFVLYVCSSILQPLFIAGLLVYLILPVHERLVRWRVPSAIAYVAIVVSV